MVVGPAGPLVTVTTVSWVCVGVALGDGIAVSVAVGVWLGVADGVLLTAAALSGFGVGVTTTRMTSFVPHAVSTSKLDKINRIMRLGLRVI